MVSCKGTYVGTKTTTFEETNRSIQSQMKSQGFELTSHESVGKSVDDNIRKDTYYFADSLGNTMEYAVFYKTKKDDYVWDSELCGCKTSNPDDFEKFCGDDGVTKPIKELPVDLYRGRTGKDVLGGLLAGTLLIALINAPFIYLIVLKK